MKGLTPLYSSHQIAGRVKELAGAVSQDYAGRDLVLVGLLKGSFIFMADLVRSVEVPVTVDFVGLSSYGSGDQSRLSVQVTKEIQIPIQGRDVLVVEDILDTAAAGLGVHRSGTDPKPVTKTPFKTLGIIRLISTSHERVT